MKKISLLSLLVVSVVTLVVLMVLAFSASQTPKEGSDVAVSSVMPSNYLYLQSPNPLGHLYSVGDQVELAVKVKLLATGTANTAEIVVNYDTTHLSAISFKEVSSKFIGINNSIDTDTGVAKLDVALTGDLDFTNDIQIARIKFEIINTTTNNTFVKIDPASTIGSPDISEGLTHRSERLIFSIPNDNDLILKSNSGVGPFNTGDDVIVAVIPRIVSSASSVTSTDVYIKYDNNNLALKQVLPATGYSINTFNNALGDSDRFYIQVNKKPIAPLSSGDQIALITFTVKPATKSTAAISVDVDSTLGSPNTLSPTGFGSLSLTLNPPTPPAPTIVCKPDFIGTCGTNGCPTGTVQKCNSDGTQLTCVRDATCPIFIDNGGLVCSPGSVGRCGGNNCAPNQISTCNSKGTGYTCADSKTCLGDPPPPPPPEPPVIDAPVCGNLIIEKGEACDDGNRLGSDFCSADCTKVTSLSVEPGHCIADYDNSGTIDISDLGVLADNYNQVVSCDLDIVPGPADAPCTLDLNDLQSFIRYYKIANFCLVVQK